MNNKAMCSEVMQITTPLIAAKISQFPALGSALDFYKEGQKVTKNQICDAENSL